MAKIEPTIDIDSVKNRVTHLTDGSLFGSILQLEVKLIGKQSEQTRKRLLKIHAIISSILMD